MTKVRTKTFVLVFTGKLQHSKRNIISEELAALGLLEKCLGIFNWILSDNTIQYYTLVYERVFSVLSDIYPLSSDSKHTNIFVCSLSDSYILSPPSLIYPVLLDMHWDVSELFKSALVSGKNIDD